MSRSRERRLFAQEEVQFIKDNYAVMGPKFISELLDRDRATIASKAWSLGLSVHEQYLHRAQSNDDDIREFEYITKPEVAYFLGYFWADGYLEKNTYRLKFQVCKDDFKDVKRYILPLMQSWSYAEYDSDAGTRMSDLRICHKGLYDLLVSLDFDIKTGTSASKVIDDIPEHLRHYWWRGYFDGDGSFGFYQQHGGTVRVVFAACFEQDWTFVDTVHDISNIDWRIQRTDNNDGRSSCLLIEGQACTQRFCEYIYAGEWMGLKRKYKLYKEWMEFRKSVRPNKTSKHRGVTRVEDKWLMRVYKDKIRHFAWFGSEQDAAHAYNEKAKKLFGNKAVLNQL